MSEPSWPEWGALPDRYLPWHVWTSPAGAHHAGHLLDTVIGPSVATSKPIVYEVLRCEPCLSIHVTPLPEPEALATYYAEEFFQRDKPDYLQRYLQDARWWSQAVHEPIIGQAIGLLQKQGHWQDPLFLDIGAGPGLALDAAKNLGAQTFGIEPNAAMCQQGWKQGHAMLYGTLETVDMPSASCDIVMSYEVLEHQACPEEFVLRCVELLRPGGIFICVVPNDYNPIQMQACQTEHLPRYFLAPPQHLHYFTPKMLQLLLRRCGLSLCDMRGSNPLDANLLHGRNYVGNEALGRECHQERMRYELDMIAAGHWHAVETTYRTNLAHDRIGREIVALARKD